MVTSINNAHLAPSDAQQLSFMSTMPPEIIPLVFSHLNQRDCMNCMAVCRSWYNCVPQYSRQVWEKLSLSMYDIYMDNLRFERCLGSHVKAITFHVFDDEELHKMMQKLILYGCTNVHSLELKGCTTTDLNVFLSLLEDLAHNLTHLEMTRHRSNISFVGILKSCPKITHFTYDPTDFAYIRGGVYDKEPILHGSRLSSADQFHSLIYLRLSRMMNYKLRIKPILQQSPRLRYLIGQVIPSDAQYISANTAVARFYESITVPLDALFSQCPELVYFETSRSDRTVQERANTDQLEHGVRHFSTCEVQGSYGPDQVHAHLARNQETLEFLSISKYKYASYVGRNWSLALESLYLPSLHTLLFENIIIDGPALVSVLNNCPLLNTLEFTLPSMVLDQSTLQHLRTMPMLNSLDCSITAETSGAIFTMLERCPALQNLVIWTDNIGITLDITYTLGCLRQLKSLLTYGVSWKYEEGISDLNLLHESKLESIQWIDARNGTSKLLQAITQIQTLKSLKVDMYDAQLYKNDEFELCHFFKMLHGTAIQELDINYVERLSYTALEALGSLPLLEKLGVSEPYHFPSIALPIHVDQSGLLHMLRKSKSLVSVDFTEVVIAEGKDICTDDQLLVLIDQEAPNFRMVSMGDPQETTDYGMVLHDLVIERVLK